MKKQLLWILLIVIMSMGLILTGTFRAEAKDPIKLVFANWLPPMNPVSKGYDEWAREFETKSGGRYKVEISHGGVLAGIPQAYDVVVSGVADISEMVVQDVERPFPLTDIMGLPFFNAPADVYTKAWYNNVQKKGYLDKEFSEVKLLFQFAGMGEDFLTVKPINKVADLKGVKIVIGGGPTKAKLMKSLGAVGVFGGPPDAYMMLQKGIAEGVFISGLGLKEFHWDEFIHYIIGPLRVGSAMHTLAMNKNTYNKLPDDVKAIIEEMNANGRYSIKQAAAFENIYQATLQRWLKEGGKMIQWSEEETAKLNKVAAQLWKEWIETQEAKGIPARKVIDEYYNGLKALGVKNPALGYTPGQ
jgi:TRAP-type C4-dicarboxylate transport system substrate-binding protein